MDKDTPSFPNSHWLLKNSDGRPSGSFTAATISFVVVTIMLVTSTIDKIAIGPLVFTLKPVDTTFVLGYLAACFSAYVVRRNNSEVNKQ